MTDVTDELQARYDAMSPREMADYARRQIDSRCDLTNPLVALHLIRALALHVERLERALGTVTE